jgi:hypothetical protein
MSIGIKGKIRIEKRLSGLNSMENRKKHNMELSAKEIEFEGSILVSFRLIFIVYLVLTLIIPFSILGAAGNESGFTSHSRSFITPGLPPQFALNKTYEPDSIWIEGSINDPQTSTVTLNITGVGDPRTIFDPQDIVFIMDTSGSMDLSDPANYRYTAARGYIENLLEPDRAAVIQFGYDAWLVNDHHLTSNYSRVIADLAEEPKFKGQTNYEAAISMANKELIDNGEENKYWIEIFFTDGNPDPKSNNVTAATIAEAVDNNILIYTIGLEWKGAKNPLDEGLLKWIAGSTGGEYFKATGPEQLFDIYQNISKRYTMNIAGTDDNVTDNEPVVREVLPDYITVDEDSFSIEPDYLAHTSTGETVLEWNISQVTIGETWKVQYEITSTRSGNVTTSVFPESRVMYTSWDGKPTIDYFPGEQLHVMELPPPPEPPLSPPPPPAAPPLPPNLGVPPPSPSLPVINPVVTIQPQLIPVAFESAVTLPVGFALAGFAALGMLERIKIKRKIKGKQKVAIGA